MARHTLVALVSSLLLSACASSPKGTDLLWGDVREVSLGGDHYHLAGHYEIRVAGREATPLSKDGYVLLPWESVDPADDKVRLTIYETYTGKRSTVIGRTVAFDPDAGLAVVKTQYQFTQVAVLSDMREVRAGDPAFAIDGLMEHAPQEACKYGPAGSVMHPYYDFDEPGNENDVMLLDLDPSEPCPISPGSGVYSKDGLLIGIRTYFLMDGEIPIAIPADRIARFLDEHGVPYYRYATRPDETD